MALRSYGRGRPLNAPAAFIHPCQPIIAKQPPSGPNWAHELKYDGYRLQIHVRDGRVRPLHHQWCELVQSLPADYRGSSSHPVFSNYGRRGGVAGFGWDGRFRCPA